MSYLWYWPQGGWDFDRWRAQYATRLSTGDEPTPPLNAASQDAWHQERGELQERLRDLLGTITDEPPAAPRVEYLGPVFTKMDDAPAYTMQRLRYTLTEKEWGYAWLLIPQNEDSGARPAVLALHQTIPQGKSEAAGIEGNPSSGNEYGRELAEAGFVVLVPDAIAFGERQSAHKNAFYRSADDFYGAHPEGSVMAKMAFDTSRAVDVLQSLPGVDPSRIGSIGHSHGGYGTLFAMLADDRIGAGVISCGLSPFPTDPGVDRWYRRTALIPRIGLYEGKMENLPLQLNHLLALTAPRPVLVSGAMEDAIFPQIDTLPAVVDDARRVYDLYGAGKNLRGLFYPGPHSFTPEARQTAYAFLREHLGNS